MKKFVCHSYLLLLIFVPVLAECGDSRTRAYSESTTTFIVPISVEMFSQEAILRVRLWRDEPQDMSERNSACSVSYNPQTKTEEVHCPPGVEYKAVTPEEFTVPVQDIKTTITVRSHSIRTGEKYRLQISGLSRDNCNTTMAEVRNVANAETITIEKLSWETTGKACHF